MSLFKTISGLLLAAVLTACGGGGGDASTPVSVVPPTTTTASGTIATMLLSAPSPQTISADGVASITLTARALDSSNGLIKGAVLNLVSSGNTILSTSTITTDPITGLATTTLVANPLDQTNRDAIVTLTCGSCSALPFTLPIHVSGGRIVVASSNDTLIVSVKNGTTTSLVNQTITVAVKDASGIGMANQPVTFESGVIGLSPVVSFSPSAGKTNSLGVITTTVSGLIVNTSNAPTTVYVHALGDVNSTLSFKVNAAVGALAMTTPAVAATLTTAATAKDEFTAFTGIQKEVDINAPGATSITVSSTLGTLSATKGTIGSSNFLNLATDSSNNATVWLNVTQAGTSSLNVIDNTGAQSSVAVNVSPPWVTANKIILSANATTLQLKTATNTPFIELTARALYSAATGDQSVAKVPILFTMIGGPGGGEFLSPAYQLTDSDGYAKAIFTSGTSASLPNGIVVAAATLGTTSVVTTGDGTSTNKNDGKSSGPVKLTIGGQALSVAFGAASVLRESSDKTLYIQDYSVQVTDANNNPVSNATVTLRVRPVAFSLGTGCKIDPDINVASQPATYCSEDVNANGSLESTSEDGVRVLTTSQTAGQCWVPPNPSVVYKGTSDGLLTPQNSVAGSVPATVITSDGNLLTPDGTSKMPAGTAQFSLTYLKASAIWVIDKISATVTVNGTESGTSTVFQLPWTVADWDLKSTCHLPDSPFSY